MKILVTGGAGFIGSAFIRFIIEKTEHHVINVDKLTYAANLLSLATISSSLKYKLYQTDICDFTALQSVFDSEQPDAIVHFAAESHVDRSISGSADFMQTNIIGTYNLLECSRIYLTKLPLDKKEGFRLLHVSTDEVFGELGTQDEPFTHDSAYAPNSPYSASKAASDHLVRAWHKTYQLPVIISNCSNNYGPFQHTEKLIPKLITNAIQGKPLPIYGTGEQIRDWLFVDDHVRALDLILQRGIIGSTYVIGGNCEMRNIDIAKTICKTLEIIRKESPELIRHDIQFEQLIAFVEDRLGHDFRYAINSEKIRKELGWSPSVSFTEGLYRTIRWYIPK